MSRAKADDQTTLGWLARSAVNAHVDITLVKESDHPCCARAWAKGWLTEPTFVGDSEPPKLMPLTNCGVEKVKKYMERS
jgi:hypothetical protein